MFGLKKCKEEDFYEFEYSNWKYSPGDFDGYLSVLIILISVLGGVEYLYLSELEIGNKQLIKKFIIVYLLISLFIFFINHIKDRKYAYKFQKIMIIILGIYWFIFSFIIYPAPLLLGIIDNYQVVVKSVIYAAITGLIYFFVIFIRLIYLIRKGQMRKECKGLYERLIGNKIPYVFGCSASIVVISSKLGRNITKAMDNSGNGFGVLIIILLLGFVINIITITFLPEIIVLAYCKFRFKSYNIEPITFKKKIEGKKEGKGK